jgi:hypothetical protein
MYWLLNMFLFSRCGVNDSLTDLQIDKYTRPLYVGELRILSLADSLDWVYHDRQFKES